MNSRTHQNGMALLVLVMVLLVAALTTVLVVTYHLEVTLDRVTFERTKAEGNQALMDFAVLAERARNVFLDNGGACPAGYVENPAGRGFCWRPVGAVQNCIRHPRSSPQDVVPMQLCLGVANQLNVARLEMQTVSPGWLTSLKYWWDNHPFTALTRRLVNETSPFALAAGPVLPGLAGAPNNNINGVTCTAATVGTQQCKRCQGGAAQNLQCIQLSVCLDPNGCPNPEDWVTAVVGVITR